MEKLFNNSHFSLAFGGDVHLLLLLLMVVGKPTIKGAFLPPTGLECEVLAGLQESNPPFSYAPWRIAKIMGVTSHCKQSVKGSLYERNNNHFQKLGTMRWHYFTHPSTIDH